MILALILAHSFYSQQCCGERHCRPVPCEELMWRDEFIYYGPARIRVDALQTSPDGGCHACVNPFFPSPAGCCACSRQKALHEENLPQ
jgi:hypothetical protein